MNRNVRNPRKRLSSSFPPRKYAIRDWRWIRSPGRLFSILGFLLLSKGMCNMGSQASSCNSGRDEASLNDERDSHGALWTQDLCSEMADETVVIREISSLKALVKNMEKKYAKKFNDAEKQWNSRFHRIQEQLQQQNEQLVVVKAELETTQRDLQEARRFSNLKSKGKVETHAFFTPYEQLSVSNQPCDGMMFEQPQRKVRFQCDDIDAASDEKTSTTILVHHEFSRKELQAKLEQQEVKFGHLSYEVDNLRRDLDQTVINSECVHDHIYEKLAQAQKKVNELNKAKPLIVVGCNESQEKLCEMREILDAQSYRLQWLEHRLEESSIDGAVQKSVDVTEMKFGKLEQQHKELTHDLKAIREDIVAETHDRDGLLEEMSQQKSQGRKEDQTTETLVLELKAKTVSLDDNLNAAKKDYEKSLAVVSATMVNLRFEVEAISRHMQQHGVWQTAMHDTIEKLDSDIEQKIATCRKFSEVFDRFNKSEMELAELKDRVERSSGKGKQLCRCKPELDNV